MEPLVFNKSYRILAYKICYRFLRPYIGKRLEEMKPVLRKAKLYITIEEYMATAVFTVLLLFPFVFMLLNLLFMQVYEMPFTVAIIGSLIFSMMISLGVFFGFYIYPQYRMDSLKKQIEDRLPYATTHMATIAGTGVPIYVVFRMVGDFEEYGEIAKEFRKISRDIEVFGTDTLTALSEAAADTPSPHLKELLWGIVSVTRTGGDLRRYLMEKASSFMEAQKTQQERYVDSLSLLAEMYTTVFVAGPILFVVMVTIMGSMGSLGLPTDLMLSLVIYLGLPVAAVGFMLLIEGSKPGGIA
jgi:flagellar protein FlaJ